MIYEILVNLYNFALVIAEATSETLTASGYVQFMFVMIAEYVAAYAALFFFRGFALYKMAKNRNIECAYLAFVPFACYVLLGKLQTGSKYANRTKYAYLVALVSIAVEVAAAVVIDICFAINPLKQIFGGVALTKESFTSSAGFAFLNWLSSLAQITFVVSVLFAYSNVYKAYVPAKNRKYTLFNVMAYILTMSTFLAAIFLFVNRNRQPVDYDEYVAYVRARNGYYGYPPAGGYNGYNRNTDNGAKPQDDPFSEFSKKDDGDPFADFGEHKNTQNTGNTSGNHDNTDDTDDLF